MYLTDVGVDIDNVQCQFQDISSVSATPFMAKIAGDAHALKIQLSEIEGDMASIIGEPMSIDQLEFLISQNRIPNDQIQSFLILRKQHDKIKAELDNINNAVFNETKTKIKLPATMHGL